MATQAVTSKVVGQLSPGWHDSLDINIQLTSLMDYELTLADQVVSIKIRALKAVIMDLTLRHRNILSSDRPAEAK